MSPLTSLRYHLRAWKRHNIHFGVNASPFSLEDSIFPTSCTELSAKELASVGTDRFRADDAVRITDDAMLYRFPYSHKDPLKRGERNPDFLDASRFREAVSRLGLSAPVVIFPVSHVYRTETMGLDSFEGKAERFIADLSPGVRYALEVSNPEYLFPQYFGLLARYGVAHVLHDSEPMPSLLDQAQLPYVFPADRVVVQTKTAIMPEWQLGIMEIVRRCIDERKKLLVILENGRRCRIEPALHPLMEMLSHDLARLSPLRRAAA